MADDAASQDVEFSELLGFLQDQKIEVQKLAAQGVCEYSESKEFMEYCQKHPRAAAKPLMRLAERAEAEAAAEAAQANSSAKDKKAALQQALDMGEAGASALQALVNLSSIPSIQEELVSLNAPKRVYEVLRAGWMEGRSGLAHWYAMLLANITTCKAGQEALCKDEGVLNFLLGCYTSKSRPPPREGYDDPLIFLGRVMVNVLALPEGRKMLAMGTRGQTVLAALFEELGDRGRRLDMINAVQNVCVDTECHKAVVTTDLMAHLAMFLYPWEKVEAEKRASLPTAFQEMFEKEGAALTGEVPIRGAAAVSLLGLIRSAEGREYLRANGCDEVLRAWFAHETDDFVKDKLEVVIPGVRLSDKELQAHQDQLLKAQPDAASGGYGATSA